MNGQTVVIYSICNFIIIILILHASTNIFDAKAQAGWCSVQGQAFEEKMNNLSRHIILSQCQLSAWPCKNN